MKNKNNFIWHFINIKIDITFCNDVKNPFVHTKKAYTSNYFIYTFIYSALYINCMHTGCSFKMFKRKILLQNDSFILNYFIPFLFIDNSMEEKKGNWIKVNSL